ncbi:MAG: fumarylacetoacetate hydrolase family protein [Pseudomonadota bacterium]
MTQKLVFDAPPPTLLATDDGQLFPVRRIFCVGKNYADHVKEMGGAPSEDPPVFFAKPTDAATNNASVPFPPMTDNLHFEGELVVAMTSPKEIFGYAAGCDLTRRDLQKAAKEKGAPWDMAKGFDLSGPVGPITNAPPPGEARLRTLVNGEIRQDESLSSMIWPIPDILRALSRYCALAAGDLIFTGTPAGVGAIVSGDEISVEIDGIAPLSFKLSN